MQRRNFPAIGAMRPDSDAGSNDNQHAAGFRLGLSGDGRRALRSGLARMDGGLPPAGSAEPDSGALSRGRQRAPGAGSADGGIVGAARSTGLDAGSGFDIAIPKNGYAWWYVDALSDDGRHALTVIALIGSVFSPYYKSARRRGAADPLDHCAFNVVLYGPRGKRWAMTERGRHCVARSDSALAISNSSISIERGCVRLSIDEVCVPLPLRLRGEVRLYPLALSDATYRIDRVGRNLWCPISPSARVEVEMASPGLRWNGHGYMDHNRGAAPLEDDFSHWTWTRLSLGPDSAVLYDTTLRDGDGVSLALRFGAQGQAVAFEPPAMAPLHATRWRLPREVRSEKADAATVRTLEDTPFYARSAVNTQLFGSVASGMHECLSLDRFRSPFVQWMLPFRMPRRA